MRTCNLNIKNNSHLNAISTSSKVIMSKSRKRNKPDSDFILPLQNQFSVLKEQNASTITADFVTDKNTNKKVKIPPIISQMKSAEVHDAAKKFGIKNYHIKNMSTGVKIFVYDLVDFNSLTKELKNHNQEYFSYTLEHNKVIRFVLYGLPTMAQNEIEAHLKEAGLNPESVKRVDPKKKRFGDDAIYFVSFKKGTINLGKLNQSYNRIYHTICKWEMIHSTTKRPTQCLRCFRYGHAMSNCNMNPKCVFCTLDHADSEVECPLKADAVKHVCANCKVNHATNSIICPKREEYLQIKKNLNNRNMVQQKINSEDIHLTSGNFPQLSTNATNFNSNIFTNNSNRKYSDVISSNCNINIENSRNLSGNSVSSNLFNAVELFTIFSELVEGLKNCSSKEEQFRTIVGLAIKYAIDP